MNDAHNKAPAYLVKKERSYVLKKVKITDKYGSDGSLKKRIGPAVKLITISEPKASRQENSFDIQSLLSYANQISIVAVIHNIDDSSQILHRTYTDLLLIDADFTGAKSTALIHMAKKAQPHIKIVMIANVVESNT